MAANLIRTYSSDEAHRLLNLSFAQFQADRDVVRLEARLERDAEHAGRPPVEARSDLRRHRRVPPAASAASSESRRSDATPA
jgi:ATP-dependent RNA helicase HelY